MAVRAINDRVCAVGVIDWDRQVFDELLTLPEGTTYNAYIVKGSEKTALIDAVDAGFEEELITNLIRADIASLDYIILNHAEQDHTGALPMLYELFPSATIVTTEKCQDLIKILHQIPNHRFMIVKDGETLSLGDCTLEFLETPWVHWPETMMTYLQEDKLLFSCDLFGAHFATSRLIAMDERIWYGPAKRYFAEIMVPFRAKVRDHLERLSSYEIACIAPSHGPVHANPTPIVEAYQEWSSEEVKNLVIIPYISMHGSTKTMVRTLTDALIRRGIETRPFDLGRADTGLIASLLLDAATVVIATPTVLFGPHPKAANIAFIANMLRAKCRFVSIIGSYGWGGKAVEDLSGMISKIDAELLEPVYIRGQLNEEGTKLIENLADEILKRHTDNNLA